MELMTADPDLRPDEFAEWANRLALREVFTHRGLRVPMGTRNQPSLYFGNPSLDGSGLYGEYDTVTQETKVGLAADSVLVRPAKVDAGMVVEVAPGGSPDVDVEPARISLHGTDPVDANETLSRLDIVNGLDDMKFVTLAAIGGDLKDFVWEASDDGVATELMKLTTAGVLTVDGGTVWHSGNDGAGSGLNADLLDGLDSSAFAVAAHTHAFNDLTDVNITAAATADYIRYNGSDWVDVPVATLASDLAGTFQPLDATLTAFAALTIAANSLSVGTGSDAFSQTTFAANTFPARASTGDLVAKTITDFGLSLIDDADAAAARTTLGITGTTGDLVYTATPSDTDISETTDVQIISTNVSSVAANDQLIVEGSFRLFNNTAGARVYTITLDFDGAFDIEIATPGVSNSASNHFPISFVAYCSVRSSSSAESTQTWNCAAATGAGGGGTLGTTHPNGTYWKDTATDLTGTLTVTLHCKSNLATDTQTLKLDNFSIRKQTP